MARDTSDGVVEHRHEVGDVLTKLDGAEWEIINRMVDVDTGEILYSLREVNGDFEEIMTESQISRSYNVSDTHAE